MSKVKNIITSILLSGIVMGSLAACSPGDDNVSKNAGNKLSSTCDVQLSSKEITKLGDAVPAKTIKDEYGEYCKLGLNTKSKNVKFDASKIDASSFGLYGFTEDDAKQAQNTALKLIVEQHLDSTRLDNYTVSPVEWFNDYSELFFDGVTDVVEEKGLKDTGIIVTDVFPEPLSRNGKPRASDIKVTVTKIEAITSEDSTVPTIQVSATAVASYPASDQLIIDTALTNNEGLTVEQIESYSPELFDGKDDSGVVVNANYRFSFDKGNMKQFTGAFSEWDLTSYEGKIIIN